MILNNTLIQTEGWRGILIFLEHIPRHDMKHLQSNNRDMKD